MPSKYMDEKKRKAYEKVINLYVNGDKNLTSCCNEIGINPSTFYKYRKLFSNNNNNSKNNDEIISGGSREKYERNEFSEERKDNQGKLLKELNTFFSRKYEHII